MTPLTQSTRILEALKQALRDSGITYLQVARHLGLSESAVKRQFSRGGFALERLEEVAALAGLDLVELARLGESRRQLRDTLTVEQETELVSDERLLLVAVCALNRWQISDMIEIYSFRETELIRLLIRLQRLGLIEVLPGNRIRVRVARSLTWLKDGPIHRYFVKRHQAAFLEHSFAGEDELHRFRFGMVAPASAALLLETIGALFEQFQNLSSRDESRPRVDQRGTCLLVALREWEPEGFEASRNVTPSASISVARRR